MSLFHLKSSLPAFALRPSIWAEGDLDRWISGPIYSEKDKVQAADLYETDDTLILELSVPGLTGNEIDISVLGRKLEIKVTIPDQVEEDRRYSYKGINHDLVSRTIDLPASVDLDEISACVENGLLTIKMPKASEAKVKKIVISN